MQPSDKYIGDVRFNPDVRIRLRREGPWLVAVADVSGGGKPIRLTARANLEKMERYVKARLLKLWNAIKQKVAVGALEESAAVGFFGFIKKAFKAVKNVVKKVANSNVVKAIRGAVKSVIKSKYVGYALSAAAVVFPPVGVPAAAAFYSAQKILKAAEAGGAAATKAVKMVGDLRKLSRKPGQTGAKARKALKVLQISKNWRDGIKRARPRPRRPLVSTRPRRVRGSVRLPTGQRAQMLGVQRGNRIQGFLVTQGPAGRKMRGAFTANVSGDDGANIAVTAPMGATNRPGEAMTPGSLWD